MSQYRQPAEWAPHDACWVAWPSHGDLWLENLEPAQKEVAALFRGIRTGKTGERLEVLVPDAEQEALAARALEGLNPRFHRIPFGDIWLRDTAPIFVSDGESISAARFGFNGWGEKYVLDHDTDVSERIATASKLPSFTSDWVLEGGSIEVDGEGTCLTTRQCLLNKNRNPGLSQAEIERRLAESLGVTSFIWIDEGLLNDHTDGHIDTIARFVAPGVVVCMEARDSNDPNRAVMDAIARQLTAAKLDVVRIPSPGRVEDEDGRVMPASFVNFYIANEAVIVPTYGTKWDDEAVAKLAPLFPGRKTFGSSARAILSGGGAFHCITQQQPAGGSR